MLPWQQYWQYSPGNMTTGNTPLATILAILPWQHDYVNPSLAIRLLATLPWQQHYWQLSPGNKTTGNAPLATIVAILPWQENYWPCSPGNKTTGQQQDREDSGQLTSGVLVNSL